MIHDVSRGYIIQMFELLRIYLLQKNRRYCLSFDLPVKQTEN